MCWRRNNKQKGRTFITTKDKRENFLRTMEPTRCQSVSLRAFMVSLSNHSVVIPYFRDCFVHFDPFDRLRASNLSVLAMTVLFLLL